MKPRHRHNPPSEVALRNCTKRWSRTEAEISAIAVKVANYLNVPVSELKRNVRKHGIVQARQIAMYFCIRYTPKTLEQIGQYFDKDHSKVIYSEKAVRNEIETNRQYAEMINRIERTILN